jgi:predicted ATPase
MQFYVTSRFGSLPARKDCFVLKEDNWDDFGFKAAYKLVHVDSEGVSHEIGFLHIGCKGQESGRTSVPKKFDQLDDEFFSLGGNELYYDRLRALGDAIREGVLKSLRDIAFDEELLAEVEHEAVVQSSFLRSTMLRSVRGQLRRIAFGGVRYSEYDFSYMIDRDGDSSQTLRFQVKPESLPPTNIHAIIGRNGVGKSHLLHSMTKLLVREDDPECHGAFKYAKGTVADDYFVNVVSIAFSAFDRFAPVDPPDSGESAVVYNYVGLKHEIEPRSGKYEFISPDQLAAQFVDSLQVCSQGSKHAQWRRAIKSLYSDPVFKEYDVESLLADKRKLNQANAKKLFKELSSGHKIVLLTITRLVQLVSEKSLVLFDEPEAHLHPPLLSSFIRTLSTLMTEQNGIAIIATHSPVVLQEIPKSCTWVLRRSGSVAKAKRPSCETFGENVGTLTHEVFGLEAMKSGFYSLITDLVAKGNSRSLIVSTLDDQLGSDARAVLATLLATKGSEE